MPYESMGGRRYLSVRDIPRTPMGKRVVYSDLGAHRSPRNCSRRRKSRCCGRKSSLPASGAMSCLRRRAQRRETGTPGVLRTAWRIDGALGGISRQRGCARIPGMGACLRKTHRARYRCRALPMSVAPCQSGWAGKAQAAGRHALTFCRRKERGFFQACAAHGVEVCLCRPERRDIAPIRGDLCFATPRTRSCAKWARCTARNSLRRADGVRNVLRSESHGRWSSASPPACNTGYAAVGAGRFAWSAALPPLHPHEIVEAGARSAGERHPNGAGAPRRDYLGIGACARAPAPAPDGPLADRERLVVLVRQQYVSIQASRASPCRELFLRNLKLLPRPAPQFRAGAQPANAAEAWHRRRGTPRLRLNSFSTLSEARTERCYSLSPIGNRQF